MGMLGKERPVVLQERDIHALLEGERAEKVLERLQLQSADHHSEQLLARADELAREVQRPRPHGPVAQRLACERGEVGIGQQRLEIAAVGDVEGRRRP